VAGRAYGTTALIAAAQLGHVEVVERLLAARADPHQATHDGSTARQLTERALAALREAMHGNGEATGEREPLPSAEQGGPPPAGEGAETALAAVTASLAALSATAAASSGSAVDGMPLAARLQKAIHMLEAAERLPKR
jgi:ankyrin repeat protein